MNLPGLIQFHLCTLTDKQLAEAVTEGLAAMYETGKVPSRHTPARPDHDFDLLVGELIWRFMERVEPPVEIEAVLGRPPLRKTIVSKCCQRAVDEMYYPYDTCDTCGLVCEFETIMM